MPEPEEDLPRPGRASFDTSLSPADGAFSSFSQHWQGTLLEQTTMNEGKSAGQFTREVKRPSESLTDSTG